jgi:hypothetical protein
MATTAEGAIDVKPLCQGPHHRPQHSIYRFRLLAATNAAVNRVWDLLGGIKA